MRKTSVVSALILSIVAAIWATFSISIYVIITAIVALVIAVIGLQLSKNKIQPKSTAQLAILLSVLALCLSSYKFIFLPPVAKELAPVEKQIDDDTTVDDEYDFKDDNNENELEDTIRDKTDSQQK